MVLQAARVPNAPVKHSAANSRKKIRLIMATLLILLLRSNTSNKGYAICIGRTDIRASEATYRERTMKSNIYGALAVVPRPSGVWAKSQKLFERNEQ
jgi:hypothetical protein